jgi:hypothetical protein
MHFTYSPVLERWLQTEKTLWLVLSKSAEMSWLSQKIRCMENMHHLAIMKYLTQIHNIMRFSEKLKPSDKTGPRVG